MELLPYSPEEIQRDRIEKQLAVFSVKQRSNNE